MSISFMRFAYLALVACLVLAPQPVAAGDVDLLSYDRVHQPPVPADAEPLGLHPTVVEPLEPEPEAPVVSPEEPLHPVAADPKPMPPVNVEPAPVVRPLPAEKPVLIAKPSPPVVLPKDILAPEDGLLITVAGEADLSGTYVIAKDGTITLPLIGAVAVAGKTPAAVQKILTTKFGDGYLVNPDITVSATGGP